MKDGFVLKEKIKIKADQIKNVIEKFSNIVIFGCGLYGKLAYKYLIKQGKEVIAFCDNNIEKQGENIIKGEGGMCICPKELLAIDSLLVVIATGHRFYNEIEMQLKNMKIEHFTFDEYVIAFDYDKIFEVHDLYFTESYSKEVYLTLVGARFFNDYSSVVACCEGNQYFAIPEFIGPTFNEGVFVDAGSNIGDIVEKYLFNRMGTAEKIYAFEPVEIAYNALLKRKERLILEWGKDNHFIECINAGLGRENKQMWLSKGTLYDTGSSLTEGGGGFRRL